MNGLELDLKYGLRSLRRDRSFALTVLLTFAMCIGANAALFAIVHSVVLAPLPIPGANSILITGNEYPKAGAIGSYNSSSGDYFDRLREMTAFESQAVFRGRNLTVDLKGSPQQIRGMLVTPSWFQLLRVWPKLGRGFSEEEGEVGKDQEVVLSHGLWQELYGGDMNVVGRQLRISDRPFTIVGVMPEGFNFVEPEVRLWLPLAFTPDQKTTHHSNNWNYIGRLKPGANIDQARAEIAAINSENLERYPEFKEILINAGFHTDVKPLVELLIGNVKKTLYLLWGGAFLVLLIGALNIANLALARLTVRRKEIATRISLGAGRVQLVRQLLLENVGLALFGGLAGIAMGAALLRILNLLGLEHFPRAGEVRMDLTVVLVALGLALAAGIFVGTFPLASISTIRVNDALHEDSRTGTSGKGARRLRQALVAAQIGFAFALLVGAGLLLASFRQLLEVDPGFQPSGVVTASMALPRSSYSDDNARRTFMNRALPAIRQIPGIAAAGATEAIPFGSNHSDSVIIAEGYQMKPGESLVSPLSIGVSPGYFETMGITVLRGRSFDERDNETGPRTVIVDERLARHFWPDRDPIGRRLRFPSDPKDLLKDDPHAQWMTVVGVAKTIRYENLDDSGAPFGAYYLPNAQNPANSFTFAMKSGSDAEAVIRALRSEVRRIDPNLAVFDIHAMSERIDLSLTARRTSMLVANAFGAVALFVAALGIYGVLAFVVSERTREIGIRVALGSSPGGILKLVLREGLLLVAGGLLLGMIAAIALEKTISSEVYGVRPLDPLVLGSVVALLAVVTLMACAMPARRAVSVDPLVALRDE
jgi:predicted permease